MFVPGKIDRLGKAFPRQSGVRGPSALTSAPVPESPQPSNLFAPEHDTVYFHMYPSAEFHLFIDAS